MTHHPSLGPHEGKELELMLQGKKGLALFYTDYEIPEEFAPYLQEQTIFCKKLIFQHHFMSKDIVFEMFILSKIPESTQVLRLAELLKISQTSPRFIPEIEREIGMLLGYAHNDVEYYIQHVLALKLPKI